MQCADRIVRAVDLIIRACTTKKKILLCGNGGSAADAQHLATEFVIRMNPAIKRPGIPAIALTTDTSMLTAGANDIGYDNVFARAVEALGNPRGRPRRHQHQREIGERQPGRPHGHVARDDERSGFLGKDGGATRDLVDVAIIVPSDDTQRIQEGHITIGHIICAPRRTGDVRLT